MDLIDKVEVKLGKAIIVIDGVKYRFNQINFTWDDTIDT